MNKKRRGQNLMEFAIVLSIAAAAFIAMSVYTKRGVQAGIKRLADEVGPQVPPGADPNRTVVSHSESAVEETDETAVGTNEGGSRDKVFTSTGYTTGKSWTVSEEEI